MDQIQQECGVGPDLKEHSSCPGTRTHKHTPAAASDDHKSTWMHILSIYLCMPMPMYTYLYNTLSICINLTARSNFLYIFCLFTICFLLFLSHTPGTVTEKRMATYIYLWYKCKSVNTIIIFKCNFPQFYRCEKPMFLITLLIVSISALTLFQHSKIRGSSISFFKFYFVYNWPNWLNYNLGKQNVLQFMCTLNTIVKKKIKRFNIT